MHIAPRYTGTGHFLVHCTTLHKRKTTRSHLPKSRYKSSFKMSTPNSNTNGTSGSPGGSGGPSRKRPHSPTNDDQECIGGCGSSQCIANRRHAGTSQDYDRKIRWWFLKLAPETDDCDSEDFDRPDSRSEESDSSYRNAKTISLKGSENELSDDDDNVVEIEERDANLRQVPHEYESSSSSDHEGPVIDPFIAASRMRRQTDSSEDSATSELETVAVMAFLIRKRDICVGYNADSSSSLSDPELDPMVDKWSCIECKQKNQANQPVPRYCQQCFAVRKKWFPPRRRGHRELDEQFAKNRSASISLPASRPIHVLPKHGTQSLMNPKPGTSNESSSSNSYIFPKSAPSNISLSKNNHPYHKVCKSQQTQELSAAKNFEVKQESINNKLTNSLSESPTVQRDKQDTAVKCQIKTSPYFSSQNTKIDVANLMEHSVVNENMVNNHVKSCTDKTIVRIDVIDFIPERRFNTSDNEDASSSSSNLSQNSSTYEEYTLLNNVKSNSQSFGENKPDFFSQLFQNPPVNKISQSTDGNNKWSQKSSIIDEKVIDFSQKHFRSQRLPTNLSDSEDSSNSSPSSCEEYDDDNPEETSSCVKLNSPSTSRENVVDNHSQDSTVDKDVADLPPKNTDSHLQITVDKKILKIHDR